MAQADVIGIPSGGGTSSGSGVTTMGAIGSSPNANGASISGSTLTLQPADGSFGGLVTTGTQTIAGAKTFTANMLVTGTEVQILSENSVFKIDRPGSPDTGAFPRIVMRTDSNFGFDIMQDTSTTGDFWIKRIENFPTTQVDALHIERGTGFTGINVVDPAAMLHVGGGIRINSLAGAGALQADADGDIVAISDERLKNIKGKYERGLESLKDIKPIQYRMKDEETPWLYTGFSAQNVEKGIPEAVAENVKGQLMLNTTPILAALVNAVNELNARCPQAAVAKKIIPRPERQKVKPLAQSKPKPKAK